MKVTFEREALSRVLGIVERVLPNKAAQPFYQALYLGVLSTKEVEFRVTNGDQLLSISVEAKVGGGKKGEGTALPGEEFLRLVKVAPAAEVVLTTSSDKAQVASGGAEWVLRYLTGVNWSDAPRTLSEAAEEASNVPEGLREAIGAVQYAVAKTQNRPSFRQVLIGDEGVVAADGRRAHVVTGFSEMGRFLIPEQVVDVVLDLLDLIGDSDAKLEAAEEWVRLISRRVDFVTGKLAYDYPDVLGVMVTGGRKQPALLTVPRRELVTAVMVASTAEDEGSVLLSIEGDKMRVQSESGQMKAKMDFLVETKKLNEGWSRWFTSQLLVEMLGAFDGDEISFKVKPGDDEAGVLYAEANGECAVLMPLSR